MIVPDSKLCCLSTIVLLTVWSLNVDSQIIVPPRINNWLYGRRPLSPPLLRPRMLRCADVICPHPNTRCVDAGGVQPPKCVDPCQGGGIRRGCPRIYLPICGTDGVVYSNTCYLEAAMCVNRTLDVCVVTSGECKDRRCATTTRTGTVSSEGENTNYAIKPKNYFGEYLIAPNERLVDTSINVGEK